MEAFAKYPAKIKWNLETIKRFSETMKKVVKLQVNAAIMALREDLKPSHFSMYLSRTSPKFLAQILEWVYKEINVEDILDKRYKETRPNINIATTNNRNKTPKKKQSPQNTSNKDFESAKPILNQK